MSKWMPVIDRHFIKVSNKDIENLSIIFDKTLEYSRTIKDIEKTYPGVCSVFIVAAVRIMQPLIAQDILHSLINVKVGQEPELQHVITIHRSILELLSIKSYQDDMIMEIVGQIISGYSTLTFNALINDKQLCLPRSTLLKAEIDDKGDLVFYTPKFVRVPLPYENFTLPYEGAML